MLPAMAPCCARCRALRPGRRLSVRPAASSEIKAPCWQGFRPRVAPLALTMAASSSQQAMAASSSIAGKRRKVEDETTLETTLESVIARAQQQRSAAAQARQSVKKRAAQARRECHEVVLRTLPYRATALDVRDIFPTSAFSVLTVRLITDSSKAIQSKGYRDTWSSRRRSKHAKPAHWPMPASSSAGLFGAALPRHGGLGERRAARRRS